MYTLKYKLNTNLWGRAAALLNWNLNKVSSSLYLITEDERMINGKSMIGLLSGAFKINSFVKILIEKEEDVKEVKRYFNEIGKEVMTNE
jgi:phosphotransferase system HPr-like phosphotransfer protein